jgi:hypothetical protein
MGRARSAESSSPLPRPRSQRQTEGMERGAIECHSPVLDVIRTVMVQLVHMSFWGQLHVVPSESKLLVQRR